MNDVSHNIERRVLSLHGKSRSLWTCKQCGVASKSLGQVTTHVMDTHGLPGRFKCYVCDSLFTEENDLNRHLDILHYNHQMSPPGNTGLEEPVKCHVCNIWYKDGTSFLAHADLCRLSNHPSTSQSHMFMNQGRSNDRDHLKEIIRGTLSGDYWRRQRWEHFYNQGKFPGRNWEDEGQPQRIHQRVNNASRTEESVMVIDISDDEDTPTHQARMYRSLPTSSSSSSDETDDSISSDSSTKPDRMLEDEETRARKKELVDSLFLTGGERHFYCGACTYWTEDKRRLLNCPF